MTRVFTWQSSWWFQPNWKILVKLDHFLKARDENKKIFELPPSNLWIYFGWKLMRLHKIPIDPTSISHLGLFHLVHLFSLLRWSASGVFPGGAPGWGDTVDGLEIRDQLTSWYGWLVVEIPLFRQGFSTIPSQVVGNGISGINSMANIWIYKNWHTLCWKWFPPKNTLKHQHDRKIVQAKHIFYSLFTATVTVTLELDLKSHQFR